MTRSPDDLVPDPELMEAFTKLAHREVYKKIEK